MPHPDGLPELFLDRSLGRIKVPQLLRDAGLNLVTLAEHYGVPTDESVADEEWLQLAGEQGWAVFMKDTRIRHNPAERAAVRDHHVRCFCLSSQSISGEDMAARFLDNLEAIVAACADEGPFIYVVHANRIEQRPLKD
ncbi:MAG: hypothetical protein V9E99_02965 [Microthrixaceae bacterium]|nr:hypothetical protein [Actinomycetota bacterium]